MGNALPVSGSDACSAARFEDLYAGLTPTDEEALQRFDAALSRFDPDQSLLSGSPARSLTTAMADLVQALTRIDLERVNSRQGWWDRFTGADLEARLELEVAVRCIGRDMQRLAEAATAAQGAASAMRADLDRIDESQIGHEALIEATANLLRGADPAAAVAARLQRRLGNLEALYASNRLARAQMVLATEHLAGLLDRYRDIEQLLFPLWQQHALAVAQSAVPTSGASGLDQLRNIHARFASALTPSKEIAS
ncbi:MAG TPA: hypothetical protein VEW04_00890 [Allosphingosinicella sp.]|nr:hypothetical protein [Allosphingosinicella sp.]